MAYSTRTGISKALAYTTIRAWRYFYKGRCTLGYISKVIGVPHEQLKDHPDHEVWKRAGNYLAQLAVNVFFTTSVEKIVIGGGLSHNPKLFGYIKEDFDRLVNDYVQLPHFPNEVQHPILSLALYDDTNGLLGAVLAFNSS